MLASSLLQQHLVGLLQDRTSSHGLDEASRLGWICAGSQLLAAISHLRCVLYHHRTRSILKPSLAGFLGQSSSHLRSVLFLLSINKERRSQLGLARHLAILRGFSLSLRLHPVFLAFRFLLPQGLLNLRPFRSRNLGLRVAWRQRRRSRPR